MTTEFTDIFLSKSETVSQSHTTTCSDLCFGSGTPDCKHYAFMRSQNKSHGWDMTTLGAAPMCPCLPPPPDLGDESSGGASVRVFPIAPQHGIMRSSLQTFHSTVPRVLRWDIGLKLRPACCRLSTC
jgi:hypothetical protein